jgi:hypothetical protein
VSDRRLIGRSGRPLISGYSGWGIYADDFGLPPASQRDWEAGMLASAEARRIYLEVMGDRLEREHEAEAAESGSQPRSRFI